MEKIAPKPSVKPKLHNSGIEHLRIYQLARSLEDGLYELAKALPAEEFFPLGNDLRRGSAAVAHHIAESHRRYSYTVKLEELHAARTAAEATIAALERYEATGHGKANEYRDDYTALIKQSWGLIKWLKARQTEQQTKAQAQAADELVAAR